MLNNSYGGLDIVSVLLVLKYFYQFSCLLFVVAFHKMASANQARVCRLPFVPPYSDYPLFSLSRILRELMTPFTITLRDAAAGSRHCIGN